MKRIISGVGVVLVLAAVGCGGASEKTKAPVATETAQTPAESPKKAESPKGPYITAFRIGHDLDATGKVGVEGALFGPGEPVFLSFDVPNAPADGKVRFVVASAADDKTLRQVEAPVSTSASPNVSIKIETSGWAVGDYVLREYLNSPSAKFDNLALGQSQFRIVKERPK